MTQITSRLNLKEEDFAELVRGNPVKFTLSSEHDVLVTLCDLGLTWKRMYFHIERALRDAGEGDL